MLFRSLSELLQQTGWMDEILNQLTDWLEKAASNDLMNYDQGWEPMRNDHNVGLMQYDIDAALSSFYNLNNSPFIQEIYYEDRRSKILTGSLCDSNKFKSAHALYFITSKVISHYVPNTITNLSQLYEYAQSIGIDKIKEIVEKVDLTHIHEDKLFIVLSVRRPTKIIGSEYNIEFLNFVISKTKHRKKKGREVKRTLPEDRKRVV